MRKFILNKYFLTFLGIILFFLLWLVVYFVAASNQAIFPSPLSTIKETFIYLGDIYTYKCILGSLERMLIGFVIGTVLGMILGIIVGNFTKVRIVFNPTIIALKAIPTAALVYLFLAMAGLKNAPIYVVILIVFPIIYEATASGYSSIDPYILMATRVDGVSRLTANLKVRFPLAFSHVLLGMVSSFALSFKIEIMAEVISGSSSEGIGRAIKMAYINSSNGMVPTFAYSLIAIIIMLLVTLLLDIAKKFIKKGIN